jgi:IS30 family transposase
MKTWFCDSHSPWQRGSIENANAILRRDLPRKTSLDHYSDQDITDIVWAVNSTSRKCLGLPGAYSDRLRDVEPNLWQPAHAP